MKIVLATGGSGGHIFPALYTAYQLQKFGHEVIFIGVLGAFAERIKKGGFEIFPLEAKGLSFTSFKGFSIFVLGMLKALGRSFKILKEVKPDVVCGFGGYGAFAVVLEAFFLRIPTIIHEQNVAPGRANKLLSILVQRVAVTFKESKKYFGDDKTVVTGCPCRSSAAVGEPTSLRKAFGLKEDTFTILVLGGSQGSRRINEEFLKTVGLLQGEGNFQFIHLSGKKDYPKLKEKYSSLKAQGCVFDFWEEMEKAYGAADLVVSRAGAVTICEIAQFHLPAILIPYPHAGGHQKENAKILTELGVARVIDDNALTAAALQEAIRDLMQEKLSGEQRKDRLKNTFFPDAAGRLTEAITSLIQ